jgi:hypothetical protein
MSMTHSTLVRGIQDRVLNLRAIERLVTLNCFQTAWGKASEVEKDFAEHLIDQGDKDGLKTWARRQTKEVDYGSMNLQELRSVGRQFAIRNYNRLTKAILLSEIEQHATIRSHKEIA